MKPIMKSAIVLLVLSSLFWDSPTKANNCKENRNVRLKIEKGTMELGGTVDFRTDVTIPPESNNQIGFVLNISPMAGYFVADGLEIAAKLGLGFYFGEMYTSGTYDKSADSISFGIGARYFLALEGSLVPYFGAAFGMNFLLPKGEGASVKKSLAVETPFGLMIPLNKHVAIDLGLMLTFVVSLEEEGGSTLSAPVGYMGVQAFF